LALIGFGCSLYHGFTARKMAEKIVNGPPNGPPSEYITKDEFDLYDTFKILALISFIFSVCLMKIAIKGRMGGFYSPRWSGPNNTKRQMRKFGCSVGFLVLLCFIAHYYFGQIKHTMDKYNPNHHHEQYQEQPEETDVTKLFEEPEEKVTSASQLFDQFDRIAAKVGQHGKDHGHHGHHNGHKGHGCCMVGPLIVVVSLIWHFCNYKMKLTALKRLEELK